MDTTCIAVSNKKSVFQHADNIIVMKDGRIEAQGKLDELLQYCDEFQRIWT
jgi:ATP-binding cassette subfamily B protein